MNTKKMVSFSIILIMCLSILTGCSKTQTSQSSVMNPNFNGSWNYDLLTNSKNSSDTVPIPKGFKKSNDSLSKDSGYLIEDNNGNQFVWVPLDTILSSDNNSSLKTEFVDKYFNNRFNEDMPEELMNSISAYKGFYVSRYEMTKADGNYSNSDYNGSNSNSSNNNIKITNYKTGSDSKLTNIKYDAAVNLSKQMYENVSSIKDNKGNSSVVSHLMYGSEWDAIMLWASANSSMKTTVTRDSSKKGRYSSNSAITTHNSSYVIKNIYDLAGNLAEMTQERDTNNSYYNVVRGGSYLDDGINHNSTNVNINNYDYTKDTTASSRQSMDMSYGKDSVGFRTCLYINPIGSNSSNGGTSNTQSYGAAPKIQGFSVINTQNGVVIQDDSNPNLQYVWVPVEKYTISSNGTVGTSSYTKTVKDQLREAYQGFRDSAGNSKDTSWYNQTIEAMDDATIESINNYGGFYVSVGEMGYGDDGKYFNKQRGMSLETGDYYALEGDYFRTTLAGNSKALRSNSTPIIPSENQQNDNYYGSNQYIKQYNEGIAKFNNSGRTVNGVAYSNVLTYEIAKEIADNVYGSNSPLVSHLMYGAEWDAIAVWAMKTNFTADKILNNSASIGKYSSEYEAPSISYFYARNKVNNIWGLAGNLYELTQEEYTNSSTSYAVSSSSSYADMRGHVMRGGSYATTGSQAPVAYRHDITNEKMANGDSVGFRTALYVRNGTTVTEWITPTTNTISGVNNIERYYSVTIQDSRAGSRYRLSGLMGVPVDFTIDFNINNGQDTNARMWPQLINNDNGAITCKLEDTSNLEKFYDNGPVTNLHIAFDSNGDITNAYIQKPTASRTTTVIEDNFTVNWTSTSITIMRHR